MSPAHPFCFENLQSAPAPSSAQTAVSTGSGRSSKSRAGCCSHRSRTPHSRRDTAHQHEAVLQHHAHVLRAVAGRRQQPGAGRLRDQRDRGQRHHGLGPLHLRRGRGRGRRPAAVPHCAPAPAVRRRAAAGAAGERAAAGRAAAAAPGPAGHRGLPAAPGAGRPAAAAHSALRHGARRPGLALRRLPVPGRGRGAPPQLPVQQPAAGLHRLRPLPGHRARRAQPAEPPPARRAPHLRLRLAAVPGAVAAQRRLPVRGARAAQRQPAGLRLPQPRPPRQQLAADQPPAHAPAVLLPAAGRDAVLLLGGGGHPAAQPARPGEAGRHPPGAADHAGLLPLLAALQRVGAAGDAGRAGRAGAGLRGPPAAEPGHGGDREPGLRALLPQPPALRLPGCALPPGPAPAAGQLGLPAGPLLLPGPPRPRPRAGQQDVHLRGRPDHQQLPDLSPRSGPSALWPARVRKQLPHSPSANEPIRILFVCEAWASARELDSPAAPAPAPPSSPHSDPHPAHPEKSGAPRGHGGFRTIWTVCLSAFKRAALPSELCKVCTAYRNKDCEDLS